MSDEEFFYKNRVVIAIIIVVLVVLAILMLVSVIDTGDKTMNIFTGVFILGIGAVISIFWGLAVYHGYN